MSICYTGTDSSNAIYFVSVVVLVRSQWKRDDTAGGSGRTMPLGEFFSCVWLVLLALHLMTTFPSRSHCSSHSTTPDLSSPKSSSGSSSESLSSPSEQNSDAAAISANSLCHRSIDTSELISADCQQIQQEPRMRITGEISEGPGPPSCPASCSFADEGRTESPRNEKNLSCYRYLVQKDCVNSEPNDWASIRLRHCCEHTVYEALQNADDSLSDQEKCQQNVQQLLELDAFVAKVTCQFEQVLSRYDCQQNYSVNSCQSCKVNVTIFWSDYSQYLRIRT